MTKKYKALTTQQQTAVILKVEDGLSDAEISRQVGLTPQAIGQFWKKPHIKREIGRQAERYQLDVIPKIVEEFQEIRVLTVKKLRAKLEDDMTVREATDVIKTMTQALDSEFQKIGMAQEAANENIKENTDNFYDMLFPSERDAVARRMGDIAHGKILALIDPPPKEIPPALEIEDDDNDVIEAEYMEESRIPYNDHI